MKLALVTRRYPPLIGGAEKVLSYLAAALAAEGAEVTVLTSRMPGLGLPARENVPMESASGSGRGGPSCGRLTIERLATSRLRFWGTWLYMRNLARWFDRNPVDLAYVSMLKHDAYVAVGVGARRGFPVVLRPEGAGATGDIAWQSWGRFGASIARRCRAADAVVAISPSIRDELIGDGYPPSSIVSLPNGVPVPESPGRPRPGWRAAPRASFVGRLAPEKGLDLLIDAWPDVLARHPRARLTLIGDGPERPSLAARLARLGLAGAVELPGASSDPAASLRDSDLFVLPSREEGMSVALLEAMALGIPLVASAIPGNLRLVDDRRHGRLAPPGDPAALAVAVLDQWADHDRAVAMGLEARRRVSESFSIAAVARRHMELFRSLIEARRAGRRGSAGP